MKIAQVAPLYESVPPKYYGGTERVVSYLTEELVRQGHEVTLFASGDSITSARLVASCPRALRLDKSCVDQLAPHYVMLENVQAASASFDIIHFHIDYLHFPISKRASYPHVTTLHGRLDIPELPALYDAFKEIPVVSISHSQRRPLSHANWVETIYHGLPASKTFPQEPRGDYLAFLGRISPEKRVDRAIEIARRAGTKIRIAAKVDRADADYFREKIEPLLRDPLVEFIGEIGEAEKPDFLGNARALLFPIDWPEPFGLVMIEAMQHGTPVIAWNCGSVPEVIDNGVTGFVVENLDEAVQAVERVSELSREHCRQVFESRFSATRMAKDYLAVYQQMVEQNQRGKQSLTHASTLRDALSRPLDIPIGAPSRHHNARGLTLMKR